MPWMIWTPTSSREPRRPTGSRTPSRSSTLKRWRMVWIAECPCGKLATLALEITSSTSACVISLSSLTMGILPALLKEPMLRPVRLTSTRLISRPSTFFSASRTARWIDSTTSSWWWTSPLWIPSVSTLLVPIRLITPSSRTSATTIFVFCVPTSSPTKMSSLEFQIIFLNSSFAMGGFPPSCGAPEHDRHVAVHGQIGGGHAQPPVPGVIQNVLQPAQILLHEYKPDFQPHAVGHLDQQHVRPGNIDALHLQHGVQRRDLAFVDEIQGLKNLRRINGVADAQIRNLRPRDQRHDVLHPAAGTHIHDETLFINRVGFPPHVA